MMLAFLVAACTSAPETNQELVFVRGGVVRFSDGKPVFAARKWSSGEQVEGRTAPVSPACIEMGRVDLGSIRDRIAAGIPAPDSALSWSPDGRWLAVGTFLGEVLVLDSTGTLVARRSLAETSVKQVAWSPDSRELYAGEQSVDAFLLALDPTTLETRAKFRLADALESSPPPARDDLYGIYTLPSVQALHVRANGELLVVGAHGWTSSSGRQNRSLVWTLKRSEHRFDVVAQWPDTVADATFLTANLDDTGAVISVGRSSAGPSPEGLGVGGVAVLGPDLSQRATYVPPPLKPWFQRAFVWEGMGRSGDRLTLGLADGRVWRPERGRDLSTPIVAQDVPLAATIGRLVDTGDLVLAMTSGTSIPYGSAAPDAVPPAAHPAENTLFALDPHTLETRWTWRGADELVGLDVGERWMAVGVKPVTDDPARHGVVVLDRLATDAASRLNTTCTTGQPVFFRTAVAPDGALGVVSFPQKVGDAVRGDYRVSVFR